MFGPVMIVRLQLEEAYWRGEGGGGGGKGAGHVRGGKVNASHYDVCTTLLGTGWPYVILSSIGWRPALIQRVSRENSGQTELEERERCNTMEHFFPGRGGIRKMAFFPINNTALPLI